MKPRTPLLLLPQGRNDPAGSVLQRMEHFPGFVEPHSVRRIPPGLR